jgi:LmbE family N-acetylglucosaminyl deacetylase
MMNLNRDTAQVYVPDGVQTEQALARTTHVCIAAHQDDIEIMAPEPIIDCYRSKEKWFTGVVATDGRGSPRTGIYENYSDDEMRATRFKEQFIAASIGEYAAQVMLDHPSAEIKDPANTAFSEDITALIRFTRPDIVYTHNLADKHSTHISVAVKVIRALRSLPGNEQPRQLYGCEVWRGLDWMVDEEKILLDASTHANLQAALLGVFDSQISGGKRYDLAALGRRSANATFLASHEVDDSDGLVYAMDLTPLIKNPDLSIPDYVQRHIDRFANDVKKMITNAML